ncbi:hypothetical protein CY35_10G064400 [Sphagnum magellanicum]|nr:hypothetical protein CY35_10G064400 [Sphagnum magellanicum]
MASSHTLVVPRASQSAIVSGQIACGAHLCKLTKRYLEPSLCLESELIRSTTSLRSAKSCFLPSTQTLKGQQQRESAGVVSWRRIKKESGFVAAAALFPFLEKRKDKEVVKRELLAAIQPLDRGAQATADDLANIDKIARELESLNPTKEPLKLSLLNGKWRLVYTTSETVLRKQWPKILRPNGPIYQAINTDTLRAQNLETWPFFNQVTANLSPLTAKKVAVNFDYFKIGGLDSGL